MTTATRGRGTSAGLTRESVIEAAERVVDRVGFAGASVRAVATELGVSPTALYNHVSNKQELLDEVADAFIGREVLAHVPADMPPLERVRALCFWLYEAGKQHPALLASIVGHLPDRLESSQIEYSDAFVQAFLDLGATVEQSHLAYSVLVGMILGLAIARTNAQAPGSEERIELHATGSPYPNVAGLLAARSADSFGPMVDVVLSGLGLLPR